MQLISLSVISRLFGDTEDMSDLAQLGAERSWEVAQGMKENTVREDTDGQSGQVRRVGSDGQFRGRQVSGIGIVVQFQQKGEDQKRAEE